MRTYKVIRRAGPLMREIERQAIYWQREAASAYETIDFARLVHPNYAERVYWTDKQQWAATCALRARIFMGLEDD